MALEREIQNKAKCEKSKLSRLIANYDWDYKKDSRPNNEEQKYWEVLIEKENWRRPWNNELRKELTVRQKRRTLRQSWAEQEHTIAEIGSTYTIQGFDLNYAGVILGESIQYRNGKIVFDPSKTSNSKATFNRLLSDGSRQNFAKELLKHEVRVLMTRGVNGLYIYACDDELREALLKAMNTDN